MLHIDQFYYTHETIKLSKSPFARKGGFISTTASNKIYEHS